jgi:hypothetical protein
MKLQIFKLIAILALFMGLYSCSKDKDEPDGFHWDGSPQSEEHRPVNPGEKSSSFKIDDNIISFAVPYLVGTLVLEYPPEPSLGYPEGYSPHIYTIKLIMPKGTDVTKLAPFVTLAPGAMLTLIEGIDYTSKQVNYTGIAEVGEYSFKNQIGFTVITPDGSTISYIFLANVIGAVYPCIGCP